MVCYKMHTIGNLSASSDSLFWVRKISAIDSLLILEIPSKRMKLHAHS